jgi:hypothetical protein
MSEFDAKAIRAKRREKAENMAGGGDPRAKVDASDWTPPEPLNTEAKTGLRPVSRRQYKAGGAVAGASADCRSDRKPRKTGGVVADKINRDVKEANAELGKPHVGGMRRGGRSHKAAGGQQNPVPETAMNLNNRNVTAGAMARGGNIEGDYTGGTRPTGGRIARASGGKAGKGKTNIIIAINPHGAGAASPAPAMAAMQGPVHPPVPPQMVSAPMPMPAPSPGGMPPGGMPMPPPGGAPGPMPMGRKSGGKVYRSFKDMDVGAASGLGRLEKTEIEAHK